jgi:hypothetical protein
MNILILYDAGATFTNTVWDHLAAFKRYLPDRVFYCHAVGSLGGVGNLAEFDVVIVHYTVRVAYGLLSPSLDSALQRFAGLKVLFVQDEYDYTEVTRQAIERLRIDIVFTCVPEASIGKVYAPARFPQTRFVANLTGYVPANYPQRADWRPLRDRKFAIGYRGRSLPYWYGHLGQQKRDIGVRMREECLKRGIPVDIEWDDSRRIYGDAWVDFVSNCRVTLGSESGSNVFDDTGAIRSAVQEWLKTRPTATYEEVFHRFLAPHEGRVSMNQVSPRIFEAACLGTGLVLFEGEYSGVVQPDVHYIPLKKDFSNIEDVLAKIRDDALLERMIVRTYADIIESGRYGYAAFMKQVCTVFECERKYFAANDGPSEPERAEADDALRRITTPLVVSLSPVCASDIPYTVVPQPVDLSKMVLSSYRGRMTAWLWSRLPIPVRDALRPAVRAIRARYRRQ